MRQLATTILPFSIRASADAPRYSTATQSAIQESLTRIVARMAWEVSIVTPCTRHLRPVSLRLGLRWRGQMESARPIVSATVPEPVSTGPVQTLAQPKDHLLTMDQTFHPETVSLGKTQLAATRTVYPGLKTASVISILNL